ncbi:hypothetical protein B0H17DRAFT_130333 [Mycena rosella]|uniref:Uncharacterized protein n=1 Tax=Mycena rosella TaxID=1033263 RepID=A0AAD7D2E1_MYCRO|nr:hypothetical protein B0H17DRAFT_130333 [Mycena rosella]
MSMTLAEAIPWVGPTIFPDFIPSVQDLYPDLPTDRARMQAWAKANEDSIREAMTVYIAARPDRFPPGATIDKTGSFFGYCSSEEFHIPIYWKPSTIYYEIEDFAYRLWTRSMSRCCTRFPTAAPRSRTSRRIAMSASGCGRGISPYPTAGTPWPRACSYRRLSLRKGGLKPGIRCRTGASGMWRTPCWARTGFPRCRVTMRNIMT